MDNRKVETKTGSLEKCEQLNSLQIGHLIQFTIFHFCCNWFLSNREIRQYLLRRMVASCPDFSKRKSQSVGIAAERSRPVREIALQIAPIWTEELPFHVPITETLPAVVCWAVSFNVWVSATIISRASKPKVLKSFRLNPHQLQIKCMLGLLHTFKYPPSVSRIAL